MPRAGASEDHPAGVGSLKEVARCRSPGHSVVLAVSFPVVGALIATHRPQNLIGWTFCAIGLSFALVTSAYEYAV